MATVLAGRYLPSSDDSEHRSEYAVIVSLFSEACGWLEANGAIVSRYGCPVWTVDNVGKRYGRLAEHTYG
jgi:hypothetical protein